MDNSEPSPPPQNSVFARKRRRAKVACESCRTRKRKCDGLQPCRTCVQLEYDCYYHLPAKEPKRTSDTSRNRHSGQNETESLRTGQAPACGNDFEESPYLLNLENSTRNNEDGSRATDPSLLGNQAQASACACLSMLYLMMEQLRVKDRMSVPSDLTMLRDCISSSKQVLHCQQCPRRYMSIVQNATILGALCLCIAECYRRALETIDTEAIQASDTDQQKQLCLSTSNSQGLGHSSNLGNTSSFLVNVTASEWKNVMRKTINAEVFGTNSGDVNCFMSFINALEERQRSWHEEPPAADCPPTYQLLPDVNSPQPMCLGIINEIKNLVHRLDLH